MALRGSVVADLAHLVAELVENGAHFSPPGTRVRVTGAPVPGSRGYRIDVADHGVGMTVAQLDAGNGRVRGAASGAEVTKLIGLDVVGRLAARHGITVTLAPVTVTGSSPRCRFPSACSCRCRSCLRRAAPSAPSSPPRPSDRPCLR